MYRKIICLILIFASTYNRLFSQENEKADVPIEIVYYYDSELEKIEKEIAVLEEQYREAPSLTLLKSLNQKKLKKEVLNLYASKAVKRSFINLKTFAYFSASETFLTKQKELEEKYDIKINLSADEQTLEEVKGLGTKILKTFTKNESSYNNRRIDVSFHGNRSDFSVVYKISLSEPLATELAGTATFEEHTYNLSSTSSSELVTTKFIAALEKYLSVLKIKLDSKAISQLWELRNEPDSTITFMSPAGKPFTLLLSKLSKVAFSYNDEDIQTPEKYDFFADGSLQAFTYNNVNYTRCRLEKHRENFNGYYVDASDCKGILMDTLTKKISSLNKVVVVYGCVTNGELKFKATKVPVSSSVTWPTANHNGSGTFLQSLPVEFGGITGPTIELSGAALTSTYSVDSKRFLEALTICDRDYIPYAITVANIITLCPKIISQCYSLERLIDDFDLTKHLLSTSNNVIPQTRTPLQQYQDKVVMLLQRVKELQGYANNTITTDNQTKSITNPALVAEYVNDMSNICALNFISNAERIRLLKILILDNGWGTQDAMVRLFETLNLEVPDANIIAFFDALTNPSNNCGTRSLLAELYAIITFNDYKKLSKILCIKFKEKGEVVKHYFPGTITDQFKTVFFYDDSYLITAAPVGTHKYSISLNDNGSLNISKQVVDYQTIEHANVHGVITNIRTAHWTYPLTFTLSPFTPITIVNRSSLSSIAEAASHATLTIAPAIFLKYAADQTFNDDALRISATVADVVSLATGPGLVWKAARIGKMGLALYEGAQVVGSLANITANGLPANSKVKKWIDEFNLLVTVWGGARILSNPKIFSPGYFDLADEKPFTAFDKSEVQALVKEYQLNKTELVEHIDDATTSKQVDEVMDYLGGMVKMARSSSAQALYSKNIISKMSGFSDKIEGLLSKNKLNGNFLTLGQFKELMLKSTSAMTQGEKDFVNIIRNSIPLPTSESILQKVFPISFMDGFFKAETNIKSIGGFIATAEDCKHLNTYNEIFDGLRLDYKESEFVATSATKCLIVRFKTLDFASIEIPRNYDNGGSINNPNIQSVYNKNPYPFTGQGYTAGTNGVLGVPELKVEYPNSLKLEDKAEMFIIDNSGKEEFIGCYSRELNKFVKP
ncbi:hypothetical protein CNR22_12060 [Sphingobacteriaceae bacterium]|nr:hypothetical protein CNR22_12060 [Sphingobacteriaceae bacterium]